MSFKVSDFSTKVTTYTKPSHFEVSFTLPAWAQSKGYNDSDFVRLRCHRASLPGLDIQNFANRRGGGGVEEYFPYGVKYPPIRMSFYNDDQGKIYKLFRNWSNQIVSIGDDNSNDNSYRVNYRDNYVSRCTIDHFNPQGGIAMRYNIHEIYPYQVSDTAISWDATDQITSVDVSFLYKNWTFSADNAVTNSKSPVNYVNQIITNLPGIPGSIF